MLALPTRSGAEMELATEVLRSFGELRFVARGSSMLPEIYPGDLLLVSRVALADVRAGQVVLVSREGRFYSHRLMYKSECDSAPSLVTRGDAMPDADPPVSEQDLLGRVTAVVRGKKRFELSEKPGLACQLLAWAARNSDAAAAWLLRWHLLRTRIARRPSSEVATTPNVLVECL